MDSRFYSKKGPFTLGELAETTGATLGPSADPKYIVTGARGIALAEENELTALFSNKGPYVAALQQTRASVCLLHPAWADLAPSHLQLLFHPKPRRAYGKILSIFYPEATENGSISPQAVIHPTAQIGRNCTISPFSVIEEKAVIGDNSFIGPYVVIGKGVQIGGHCYIGAHVSISHTIMGSYVRIKPGARIGQAGFGFDMDEKGHFSIPQLGRVLIGDDVEIGANTTIDRGADDDTVIGQGVRIDNLVQIAHNVVVGDKSVLVAQVGIAGSTKLGKFVIAAGQVGIASHLTIGDGVRIAAQSGLIRDVDAGETVAGTPAVPARNWHKQNVMLARLIEKKKEG